MVSLAFDMLIAPKYCRFLAMGCEGSLQDRMSVGSRLAGAAAICPPSPHDVHFLVAVQQKMH
jgi:hypothetical protein